MNILFEFAPQEPARRLNPASQAPALAHTDAGFFGRKVWFLAALLLAAWRLRLL